MENVRFAIILYVNRSGSTYLSRKLSEHKSIFVLPEVQFAEQILIDRRNNVFRKGEDLLRLIRSDPRSDALHLDDKTLTAICYDNAGGDLPKLLSDIATARLGRLPSLVVFKRESLIYLLKDLEEVFGKILQIHIVRDPRAVINSMLRTPVPEKPRFNMARNDVVFAARHWQRYLASVRTAKTLIPIKWVQYEDLEKNDSLEFLLGPLGLRSAATSGVLRKNYTIGAIDRALHQLIFDDFQAVRIDGWRDELTRRQIHVIETICHREMKILGYAACLPPSSSVDLTMLVATVQHWHLSLMHALRTLAFYLRRPRGLRDLVSRVRLAILRVRR